MSIHEPTLDSTATDADESRVFDFDTAWDVLQKLNRSRGRFDETLEWALGITASHIDEMGDGDRKEIAWAMYWGFDWLPIEQIVETLNLAVRPSSLYRYVGVGPRLDVFCWKCGREGEYRPKSRADRDARQKRALLCQECKANVDAQKLEDRQAQKESFQQHRQEQESKIRMLRSMPYAEYLRTEHWQGVRAAALKRARYACQLCNAQVPLHVHHRTYERRGYEYAADVIALCADCHKTFHQERSIS